MFPWRCAFRTWQPRLCNLISLFFFFFSSISLTVDVLWKRLQCQEGAPEGQHWSPCQTVILLYGCVKNLTSVFVYLFFFMIIIFDLGGDCWEKYSNITHAQFQRGGNCHRLNNTISSWRLSQQNDLNPVLDFVRYCFPFCYYFICQRPWKLELCVAYLSQQTAGLYGVSVSEQLLCDVCFAVLQILSSSFRLEMCLGMCEDHLGP